mgnify:CR=1 FL=1
MGKITYEQITKELSLGRWPYSGAITYVFTHDVSMTDTMDIKFTNANPCQLVNKLKTEIGKNIWICGGAEVARQLISSNMIDTYHLAVIPVLLGNGIRLFGTTDRKIKLEMVGTKEYNGIIEMVYSRRNI